MRRIRACAAILFALQILAPCAAAQKPLILLTNDDGIEAEGIQAMFNALKAIGEVVVAAPDSNQSATGHSLTIGPKAIQVVTRQEGGSTWHAVSARPATCTRLALENLLKRPPDIVVSGINRGANLGLVSYYSGTLGAAREAAFLGIPSIAVSLVHSEKMDYGDAARFAAQLVTKYLASGLPPQTFLSVNHPAVARAAIRGVRITKLSTRPPVNFFTLVQEDGQRRLFRPGYKEITQAGRGTDLEAVANGFISVTPLQLDTTDDEIIKVLKKWKLTFQAESVPKGNH